MEVCGHSYVESPGRRLSHPHLHPHPCPQRVTQDSLWQSVFSLATRSEPSTCGLRKRELAPTHSHTLDMCGPSVCTGPHLPCVQEAQKAPGAKRRLSQAGELAEWWKHGGHVQSPETMLPKKQSACALVIPELERQTQEDPCYLCGETQASEDPVSKIKVGGI